MRHHSYAAIAVGIAMSMAAGNALAAKKCNVVGAFTDSLGSSGQFTSEKKGSVSNSAICPSTYSLTITKLTSSVIDIKGKAKSCGALTGSFTFNNGGCISASGTITITGLGTVDDTVTRSGNVAVRPPASTAALTGSFK
jgi:hypothetical protein